MKLLPLLCITMSAVLYCASCSSDDPMPDPTPKPMYEKPDYKEVLTNIWKNAALPNYDASLQGVKEMSQSVDEFVTDPTIAKLMSLHAAWKKTKLQWEETEIFDVGRINTSFVHTRIDKYVTDHGAIDRIIADTTSISTELIKRLGSNKVGLPAIEYLIFSDQGNDQVLTRFVNSENADRYKALLKAYTAALQIQMERINVMAVEETETFTNNVSDRVTSSLNQIMNAQVALLEEILSLKLLVPLGNKNDGVPVPERVESPYANVSLEAIAYNLRGIGNMMSADTTKQNIYYLLDYMQRDQPTKISLSYGSQLDKVINQCDSFNMPLENAVVKNPQEVNELHTEINKLIGFIKADISSLLSLTVVFTDVDGD